MCYCSSIPQIDMERNKEGLKRRNIITLSPYLSGCKRPHEDDDYYYDCYVAELQVNIIQNVDKKKEKNKSFRMVIVM